MLNKKIGSSHRNIVDIKTDDLWPLEEDILKCQISISECEDQLQNSTQEIGELLVQYSKEYSRAIGPQLNDKQTYETKLRKKYEEDSKNLLAFKKDWRNNVLNKIQEQFNQIHQKKGSLSDALLQNSKILKQIEDHPFLRIASEEGFGPFELGADEITVTTSKLGSGAFGEVFRGVCRGKEVAVKTLKQASFNPSVVDEFFRECAIMRSLPHVNILLFMGACTIPGQYKLVTEIAPNGSLDKLLHPTDTTEDRKKIHFSRKMRMAREIAEGMNWLHKQTPPLLHLDLKPANILLMEDWTVKIADFGISRILRSVEKKEPTDGESPANAGIGGTPLYMPPEMFDAKPEPSKKCDVYAYGMILWELVTECVPFQGKYNNLYSLTVAVTQNQRPTIPEKISFGLSKLIQNCWDGNPENRPLFSTILDEETDVFNKIICDWIANGQERVNTLWSQFGKSGSMVETVDWKIFSVAFCGFMNVIPDDPKYKRALMGIRELLGAAQESGKVTLTYFERFIQCFSPIQPVGSGQSTFDDVLAVLSQTWFWGILSAQEAHDKLQRSGEVGSYLVRFSDSKDGQFVLSMKFKPSKKDPVTVTHFRLARQQDVPIITLVNNFVKQFQLKKPLPGRPAQFVSLFGKEESRPVTMYTTWSPTNPVPVQKSVVDTPWNGSNVIY